jgi:hypothetical protein
MDEIFLNCWEAKDCGREPNGRNVLLYGICPVTIESSVDGVHKGKNGGRCCWALAPTIENKNNKSTICSGGLYECIKCDFYKSVRDSTVLLVTV